MNDKRVIEPFTKIFKADNSDLMRSSALFGLVDLNNNNILETSKLKSILELALNDQSQSIREKAEKSLIELRK